MSQAGLNNTSDGPVPPTVATSYTTDVRDNTTNSPGNSIPQSNNEEILGRDTTQDNANGIRTDADPNNGKFVYVELTNRFHGSASTVGATTADIVTFSLGATPGTFFFNFITTAFNPPSSGAGYQTFTTVKTDGSAATIIGDTDSIVHEDISLITTNAQVVVSGNNAIFRVTGVSALTIDWKVVGSYITVN